MAEWTEQGAKAEISGWVIEVNPGVVTLADSERPVTGHPRAMDLEHAIELRDTLTEAIARVSGVVTQVTPTDPEPRIWLYSLHSYAGAPRGVGAVRDNEGDLWKLNDAGCWQYEDPITGEILTLPSWIGLLGAFGPLTEVVEP